MACMARALLVFYRGDGASHYGNTCVTDRAQHAQHAWRLWHRSVTGSTLARRSSGERQFPHHQAREWTGTRSANRNKGRFVVKVQCAGTGRMPHMIYNKERDVNASVGSNQGYYVKLREAVMSKGLVVYGNKGKAYFMAWLSSKKSGGEELIVDASEALEMPGW